MISSEVFLSTILLFLFSNCVFLIFLSSILLTHERHVQTIFTFFENIVNHNYQKGGDRDDRYENQKSGYESDDENCSKCEDDYESDYENCSECEKDDYENCSKCEKDDCYESDDEYEECDKDNCEDNKDVVKEESKHGYLQT